MPDSHLPQLLASPAIDVLAPPHEAKELHLLQQARSLFDSGFYDHALLDIWNAAVHNLRRRVEAYGVDLFISVVKNESGRKRYDANGDTLADRWSDVDDLVLIAGSTQLGLLNPKAGKALEMINWMRNHASPAHDSDHSVGQEDVIAHALILQKNLFQVPMPDPGHSVSGLFDPVKTLPMGADEIALFRDQIKTLRTADLRIAFGFMLDLLGRGDEPALFNVTQLFPSVWERAGDDLRKATGLRYHTLTVNPSTDESGDKQARARILDFLVGVGGVKYIPDAPRARIYRKAAKALAEAKDTSYGWSSEVAAARTLNQFGPYVPNIAFEEVYQEILAVWCGNYWGRSQAYAQLAEFFRSLSTDQVRRIVQMFVANERVRSELFQATPRGQAITLLGELRAKLTIEAHKTELDLAIDSVRALNAG